MAKHLGDDADSEAPKLLLLLSRGGERTRRRSSSTTTAGGAKDHRVFECKTCSRTFPTFQALGGHRTGHKRPREGEDDAAAAPPKKVAHECPVCGIVFPLGQALGGHMRRHKDILAVGKINDNSKFDREGAAAASDGTAASEPLSGCSSDGDGMVDDLKGGFGSGSISMGTSRDHAACFVDLELRLGLAPRPAVVGVHDEVFLTALRLGVEA